ncbi:MAG: Imm7 family immunity protein [Polyangiaceae bacterium]
MHGWAVVSASTYEDDDSTMAGIVTRVRERVMELSSGNPDVRLFYVNGACHLTMTARPNHYGPAVQEVLDFWAWLGGVAPGSYGLMYVRDDEDPARSNEFVVHVLRRGKSATEADSFLSPCVPVIEDAWR